MTLQYARCGIVKVPVDGFFNPNAARAIGARRRGECRLRQDGGSRISTGLLKLSRYPTNAWFAAGAISPGLAAQTAHGGIDYSRRCNFKCHHAPGLNAANHMWKGRNHSLQRHRLCSPDPEQREIERTQARY